MRRLGWVGCAALLALTHLEGHADSKKGAGIDSGKGAAAQAERSRRDVVKHGDAAHREMRQEQTDAASRGQGLAKSEEMRRRRDERKALKDDHEAAVQGGADPVHGQKPWWKFWGAAE